MPPHPTLLPKLLTIILLQLLPSWQCVHDQMAANITFHYYNDLSEQANLKGNGNGTHWLASSRLLQDMTASATAMPRNKYGLGYCRLRIYADYTLLSGDIASQNVIKRVVNISANFYYNTLKVDRLDKLLFPTGIPLQCTPYL